MPREVITTSYTEEEFKELLKSIVAETVKEEIDKAKALQATPKPEKIFLSRNETAKILGVSLPTLNARSVDGTIPYGRLGRKIYYKWEDIDKALMGYEERRKNRYRR